MNQRRETTRQAIRRIRKEAAKIAATRTCGTCMACCTTHAVPELGKAAGERCPKLGDAGCTDYENRPKNCREWSCVWRRGGLAQEERPDACGVVIDILSASPERLEASEVWQGSILTDEALKLTSRLSRECEVELVMAKRRLPVVG